MERLTLYGSFTSSSSYKPMLYLALAQLPFSFRTVNLKYGVQKEPPYLAINRWGVVPSLRHRGLTILQSNVILDYLARETGREQAARPPPARGPAAPVCRRRGRRLPRPPRPRPCSLPQAREL